MNYQHGLPATATTTALDVLHAIDLFLSSTEVPPAERHALWSALTALRGPDDINNFVSGQKYRTTARIRTAALPLTAAQTPPGVIRRRVTFASPPIAMIELEDREIHTHFGHHVIDAATALGLRVQVS